MEPVDISCADDYLLRGTFFRAQTRDASEPVLLCPATGVPQTFYFKFCTWLSEQGFDVLVFDYRGIGQSLHGHVRDSDASLQQWGELDQPAALDWLLEYTNSTQVRLLGHSAGGQMLGILPNHKAIKCAVGVASSTGYFGGMPPTKRALATLLMKGYMPLSVCLLKYANSKSIGWGEDLPGKVALQWRDWCSRPGYVLNSLGSSIQNDYHAEFDAPITVLHADDDWIATSANVADLLRLYPRAEKQVIRLAPSDYGYPSIGHIEMFRSSRNKLWPIILDALGPEHSNKKAA